MARIATFPSAVLLLCAKALCENARAESKQAQGAILSAPGIRTPLVP